MPKIWFPYWESQKTHIQHCISTWQQTGKPQQMKLSGLRRRRDLYGRITANVNGRVKGGLASSHLLALVEIVAPMLGPTDQITMSIDHRNGGDWLDFS
jgi:hypothetical protein